MQPNLAPVVLFVYNRLVHLKKTISSLQKNFKAKDSLLFIFSDGPKNEKDIYLINKVRDYLKSIKGFQKVTIIGRKKNLGLANSIITGVSEIVTKYNSVIVLEDDLVTSPYFLSFMNEALKTYQNDNKVASIHGYIYPINSKNLADYFFIKGADCWGWATWQRAWQHFEKDGKKLLKELQNKNLEKEFDFNNSYPYVQMLKDQINFKNDSWAIRWYASAFLKNLLTLYPKKPLVKNIGFDGSGEHCSSSNLFDVKLNSTCFLKKVVVAESIEARMKIEQYFKLINSAEPTNKKKQKSMLKIKIKKIIYKLSPNLYLYLKKRKHKHLDEGVWQGNYKNWQDAKKFSTGYAVPQILKKSKAETLVLQRQITRNKNLFKKTKLLEGLKLAINKNKQLNVLDFGGALGAKYFDHINYLDKRAKVNWSIIEQKHFVNLGEKEFKGTNLKFYYNLKDYCKDNKPQTLLLSSVLQYIEKPYELLDKLLQVKFDFILIDRTPFNNIGLENKDIIKLQIVPPDYYDASYACWFFDKQKFMKYFLDNNYEIIEEFKGSDGIGINYIFKGFIMKKANNV